MILLGTSRRRLLASIGGAALASRLAPFIPASVRAAGASPRRMLVVFHPMGYLERTFWPQSSGGSWTLGETMSALAPWKDKLIYPDGLEIAGAGASDDNEHGKGMNMVFTGSRKQGLSTGPSVEQAVANHLYAQTKTRFRALGLGVNGRDGHPHNTCFFTAAQVAVKPDNDPNSVFSTVFKDFTDGGGTDPSLALRAERQKKSVIDFVKGDLDRVCQKAGTEDRKKCEAHLDGVRMLEVALGNEQTAPATCTKPAAPGSGDLVGTYSRQVDMLAAALACDLTRVVTLQMAYSDGGLDMIPGINHHNTTHAVGDTGGAPGPISDHQKIDRWFADRWVYLLKKLSSYQESDGTLLDNTLVLVGSDTTTRGGAHSLSRFTYWMAGGGNFAFKTGRHVQVAPAPGKYTPNHRLFVSICNAFGMNVSKFGNLDNGSGPLAGL